MKSMGFLNIFHKEKHAESVILIDIAADSVAGAYACFEEEKTPVLLYMRRFPIEIRKDEPEEQAMLRTLLMLGNELIREGAPVLMRTTGSGSVETIFVSVDTPWQETRVRTEHFERENPFVFTKSIVASVVEKTSVIPPEKLLVDESIIGTILNGYETHNPYGKKVHRAALVILTSSIDKNVSKNIMSTLRGLFHTRHILFIVGNSLRYQAMLIVFPHEREGLILDVAGPLTSIALLRKGLLVMLSKIETPYTVNDHLWTEKVAGEFAELAKYYPLPRTIFLLARESEISSLHHALDVTHFGQLWLSDNPPKVVPVLASHIAGSIRQMAVAPPDLQLLFMMLYYQHHGLKEKSS
ncbi:MAG: hypothetical protein ABSB00_00605 [Minisyncoccia bacterium]